MIAAFELTGVIGREDSRTTGKLNLEDDFAELRAGFKIGVGVGGFRERKDAIDDGFQFAGGH